MPLPCTFQFALIALLLNDLSVYTFSVNRGFAVKPLAKSTIPYQVSTCTRAGG